MENTKALHRFNLLARKLAMKSDHPQYRLGCVIFKRSSVVSVGFNQLKTHPKSLHPWGMIHAEFHAILGVSPSELKGASVLVYRETAKGNVGMAKPCKSCEKMLKQVGVSKVYYTNESGNIDSYNF